MSTDATTMSDSTTQPRKRALHVGVTEFRVLTMSNQCVVRVRASPRCHILISDLQFPARMCSNLVTVDDREPRLTQPTRACDGTEKQKSVHNEKMPHAEKTHAHTLGQT